MKCNSFYPVVMTGEVKKCADFFRKYLDFGTTFEADWYISLKDENENELAFLDYRHETVAERFRSSVSGLLLNVEVDDADAVYERWKEELADRIVLAIRSEDFGQRHFIVEAPSGILVDVIQVIPPSEEYRANYE